MYRVWLCVVNRMQRTANGPLRSLRVFRNDRSAHFRTAETCHSNRRICVSRPFHDSISVP